MNGINFNAFSMELTKLGEEGPTRDQVLRAMRGAGAVGLGSGLGYAGANLMGHYARRSGISIPRDLQLMLNRGGLAAGALGGLGSELLRREYYDYVEGNQ